MNFFFATLFGFFLAVQASPWVAPGVTLDVYDPAIILPNADSFWKAGEPQLVVWYVMSSRQKVLRVITESPMIQGTPRVTPPKSRTRRAVLSP